MDGRRNAGARPVMSALPPRATPDDLARLHVLEATIETLKAENEILKRQLVRAAQAAVTERLDALAADRLDQLAAERARPWWPRLAG